MRVIKKGLFDICAGDCANCTRRGIKNLSLLTVATKKKVVTKYVPPDMGAIKLSLELDSQNEKDVAKMTDDELRLYEKELMSELGIKEEDNKNTTDDDK